MSSCLCTRPTNGMRLSYSFREDISPRSIPSGRSRTRNQLSTMVANRTWELRRNKGLDATFRYLIGAVFWKCAALPGQSIPTAEFPTPVRTYHLLREDDDWSFLADPVER